MELYKGYIQTRNKHPLKKFKDRELLELGEAEKLYEYAGVLADDVVLVDIDNMEESEKLMNIVEDRQIDCVVYQTTRGRHFLFRNAGINKCGTHVKLACGLTADIKIGSKNSYEVIKFDGKKRFIEWESEEIQDIPKFLFPVRSEIDFNNLGEGDGRNQALFNYILTLNSNGYSKDEAREVLSIINKYVMASPVSENELQTIMRDEAFPSNTFFEGRTFLHNNFAEFLIAQEKICKINGQLHSYSDGQYVAGVKEIESKMLKYIPTLKQAQRTEVIRYIDLVAESEEEEDARYIGFRNGVYDITTGELLKYDGQIIITNKIPWNYDEDAYSEICDKTLNKIACGDKQIRRLLEEAIGYSFYRRNELSKAFFLTGSGANGKSTFLDMLKNLLGEGNYSSLDVSELEERFSVATLSGKLANIGDDINDDFLQGRAVSTFKKIVSGNQVKGEYKGQDAFFFNPYTKLYFSANSLPRVRSKGFKAIVRRLVIIPFQAVFSKSDPDYDPYITWKLKDEEVMRYLVKIGIEGLKRVIENRGFTVSEKVEVEKKEYEIENNPILMWANDYGLDNILNEETKKAYKAYRVFCIENGYHEVTLISFTKSLKNEFGIDVKRVRINKELVQIYVKE